MSDKSLLQTTQFIIKELYISTGAGDIDISQVYTELNIFDNIFTPCMSGCVLIKDANNIYESLKIDGSQYIKISVDKFDGNDEPFSFNRRFRIDNISRVSNINQTSVIFKVSFISEEYLISERNKVSKSYEGKYSGFVSSILQEYFSLTKSRQTLGRSRINDIVESTGIVKISPPPITPFHVLDWITKRAVYNTLPTFLFFENKYGYNFTPLNEIYKRKVIANINFKPKNFGKDIESDFYGVRRWEILNPFDVSTSTTNGVFSGKGMGFDSLTRTTNLYTFDKKNIFDKMNHANRNPIEPYDSQVQNKDSRFMVFPCPDSRRTTNYIQEKDPELASKIDNTQEYLYQRRAILYSLLQRRINIVMPGNFSLCAGEMVRLNIPSYTTNKNGESNLNEELSGNYIIIASRNIMLNNRHETIIQVATDSKQ